MAPASASSNKTSSSSSPGTSRGSFFLNAARAFSLSWLVRGFFTVGICFFLGRTASTGKWLSFDGMHSNHNPLKFMEDYMLSSLVSSSSSSSSLLLAENVAAGTKGFIDAPSSFQNRRRIDSILALNQSAWEHYQAVNTNTLNFSITNDEHKKHQQKLQLLDVTQNVPRIQDFLKPRKAPSSKTKMANQSPEVQRLLVLESGDEEDSSAARSHQQQKKTPHEPLNIVLFYADDWTQKVLGKLNPHVQTPNIDQMADQGMLFQRNCVTTSICWISRNTLATGVYAAVHKTVHISSESMFNVTVPWLDTLYPLLRRAGYWTGLVGKWHAPQPPNFMTHTFDRHQFYYGSHWMKRGGQTRHVTDLNGEDAIQFLQTRPRDKKFHLTVSFFATHAEDGSDPPYKPMTESLALYQDEIIPRPKTATDAHYQALPHFMKSSINEGRQRWKNRFDTDENYQDKIKNLYRMATEVDAVVGAVIAELKQQGVYNQTLLVFTTDNGNLHGEHGLAEKWYAYEESIRVPLVIQDPRMPLAMRGMRNDEFTLSVDLAPTILSAAGIVPPAFMQGRDIAQLYLQPELALQSWRQDFFYEWTMGDPVTAKGHFFGSSHIPSVFALVRKDYKYFYWPDSKYEQLFHVEQDPYEESDLFASNATTTADALQIMRARYAFLKQWAQSGNPV